MTGSSIEFRVPSAAVGGAVTIGNFDGVHRGHQTMLARLRQIADSRKCPAVVVTFDPHPVSILNPSAQLPRLSTIPERIRLLRRFGATEVVVLPVSHTLLTMSPESFFQEVVVDRLQAQEIVEGPDFRFGCDRAGDTTMLRQLCRRHQLTCTVIETVREDDRIISSTVIRSLLNEGRMEEAVDLLGHPYTISGVVASGAGRGRLLGFPTANLSQIETMLPADGVYAGLTRSGNRLLTTAVSIGPNPTFADTRRKVECHICDFSGELYENVLNVHLCAQVRKLQTFESQEQLVAQIQSDVARCRELSPAIESADSAVW